VVDTIPEGEWRDVFGNGLLLITHVRNKLIAFSLGAGLPEHVKPLVFLALPILVIVFLLVLNFISDDMRALQRWAIAGIVGGGIGNLIDRFLRPDGVVDFISIKLYGLFGFARWPTFNLADAAVVGCIFLWLVALFLPSRTYSSQA
jgi:signal peptidase II